MRKLWITEGRQIQFEEAVDEEICLYKKLVTSCGMKSSKITVTFRSELEWQATEAIPMQLFFFPPWWRSKKKKGNISFFSVVLLPEVFPLHHLFLSCQEQKEDKSEIKSQYEHFQSSIFNASNYLFSVSDNLSLLMSNWCCSLATENI